VQAFNGVNKVCKERLWLSDQKLLAIKVGVYFGD